MLLVTPTLATYKAQLGMCLNINLLFFKKKLNTFIFTVRALSSAIPHLSPGPSTKKLYLGLAVGLDPQSPLITVADPGILEPRARSRRNIIFEDLRLF